ncbi:MAG: ribosome biogenesis GTP-binding protein YihA/YsxC [Alphaproteobacteria bacterium]|jgi:GTP-binding protein|nr:ribosome biogenesis GTP-binding protein YihA/YsxC [Alphaproteobacteria bacterium]
MDEAGAAEALEYGRWLFAQPCDFVLGAAEVGQLPAPALPEVAFAGRSNVGKSSLINALTGRKTLARISNTPGRTRQINFFRLGARLMLADLPGYGYARAAKHEIKRWNELILDYLKGRPNLRRVCLLIDTRHGLKAADLPVMALLDEAAVSYQVVLTKADKLKPAARPEVLAELETALRRHPAAHPEILTTSSVSAEGIADLRAALAALAGAA